MTLHSFHWPYHFIHIILLVLNQPQFHPTWYFLFSIWPSYLCTCSSIPESNLQSGLVVYNLLYFTYAPQFVYQLSLPSSRLKFPFVISISSHYLLNLCHSKIKDMISARAQRISLHQVLTKSPPPLSSIGPLVQFILTFLLPSGPPSDLSPEDLDLTLIATCCAVLPTSYSIVLNDIANMSPNCPQCLCPWLPCFHSLVSQVNVEVGSSGRGSSKWVVTHMPLSQQFVIELSDWVS